ncbi:hypothetical protein [Aliivibrio kagoshimensis]|uniref:hypothetical protein n=1 Tax=Aliivibrio kagoshimensis TaxID=2910230 RepID=UPI003D0A3B27
MNKATVTLLFVLLSTPAIAINTSVCERDNGEDNRYSTCELNHAPVIDLDINEMQSMGKVPEGYWEHWAIQPQENPVISHRFNESVLGIGVWSPEEEKNRSAGQNEETYSEWIMGHGLQLSIGIGSQSRNEPRLRIDYLWHEKLDDSVSFQVEIPLPTQ